MIRILMLCLLFGMKAYAGKEGHGGHTVRCQGSPTVVLDYFLATMPDGNGNRPATIDVEAPDLLQRMEILLFSEGEFTDPYGSMSSVPEMMFRSRYFSRKKEIGSVESWKNANLKDTTDLDLPLTLPKGCHILQAAVRQDGVQYANNEVMRELSEGQKAILQMHEILYSLLQDAGVSSPVRVRNLIEGLLRTEGNAVLPLRGLHIKLANAFLREMGIGYHWLCSVSCLTSFDNRNLQVSARSFYPEKALSEAKRGCAIRASEACLQLSSTTPYTCVKFPTQEESCTKQRTPWSPEQM